MSDKIDPTDIDRYPMPEEISELPDRIRHYIHDLETRCDPAGDLRRLDAEKQKVKELQADIERLRGTIKKIRIWLSNTPGYRRGKHWEEAMWHAEDALDGGGGHG